MGLYAGQQRYRDNRHLSTGQNEGRGGRGDLSCEIANSKSNTVHEGADAHLRNEAGSLQTSPKGEKGSAPSSSDEAEGEAPPLKPYRELLQSLVAKSVQGTSRHKRRRVEIGPPQTTLPEEGDQVLSTDTSEDDQNAPFEATEGGAIEHDADPYERHFSDTHAQDLSWKIQAVKSGSWTVKDTSKYRTWSCGLKYPKNSESEDHLEPTGRILTIDDMKLKKKLCATASGQISKLDALSGDLAGKMFGYQDVLFPLRTLQNAQLLRKLACLHSVNHVFTTRDKVLKNNARFAKDGVDVEVETRDQGFTRPKVLIILPTRQSCVRYVETLMSFCTPEQQENKKRFLETFSSSTSDFSDNKPEDFRELFGGNDDDLFRLGVKFTRKTVKLFSKFYNSDMIIASPLGLRMALAAGENKKPDHDYLSSIELLIVDQADALLMQNWEHVEYIFEHLNLQPKEAHGCDFSRVRNWYLDGNARYVRQTLAFSAFNFVSLNKMYATNMLNVAGKAKFAVHGEGLMAKLSFMPKQSFSRFGYRDVSTEPDARFEYFSQAVLPSMIKSWKQHQGSFGVLILLPSYADFLRVRNYMAASPTTQDISFGAISEDSSVRETAQARSHFLSGQHSVLLYTERVHHFRRYHIKGVKKIIMYGLPENPIFYKEIIEGYIGASLSAAKVSLREAYVKVLFSRLDVLKLERIVGTVRHTSMLQGKQGDTFDFMQ